MNNGRFQQRLGWLFFFAQVMTLLLYCGVTEASQSSQQCQLQIEKTKGDAILKSRIFGDLVQQNLAVIYKNNTSYEMDYNTPGELLSDGKVGRITEKWLGYFCNEFNQADEVSSNRKFVTNTLSALVTVAQLTDNYPLWRQVMISEEFHQWLSQHHELKFVSELSCSSLPTCYGTPVQLHSIFDKYYLQKQEHLVAESSYYIPPVKIEDHYYLLDSYDIETLTSWSKQGSLLYAATTKTFKSDRDIGAVLTPILTSLIGELASDKMESELSQLITVTAAQYQVVSTSSQENSSQPASNQEGADAKPTDKASSEKSKEEVPTDKKSTAEASTPTSTEGVTKASLPPSLVTSKKLLIPASYAVNSEAVTQLYQRYSIVILSAEQLKLLTPLSGKNFANIYLFQVALNDQLPAEAINVLLKNHGFNSLYKLAQKQGEMSQKGSTPLLWLSTPDCGCADNITLEDNSPRFYYGFYQYWQQQAEATIDYSQLTRMAYFSASIENNKVTTPNNWQANNPNAEFIVNAHNHRVKVDLVFSNIASKLLKNQLGTQYNDELISQIVATVKTPLKGYTINKMKPIMSFNQSPSRTMADGVTLNLDLSELKTDADFKGFIGFIKKLKKELNSSKLTSLLNDKADIKDEYYLNILVPAYDLIANNTSFYNIDNLKELEPSINLFIMNFEPLAVNEEQLILKNEFVAETDLPTDKKVSSEENTSTSSSNIYEVSLMKQLRTELGEQEYSEVAGTIFRKSIPLIHVENDSKQLTEVLNYAKWSYLGAAFWSYPLSDEASKLINLSYFVVEKEEGALASAVDLATQVCNTLCPLRWELRVVIYCLIGLVLIYAVASIWAFRLRQVFSRWYFLLFMLASAMFIMLVFSCDPYWKEQQQLFIFIFILIVFAVNVLRQKEINNRSNLP